MKRIFMIGAAVILAGCTTTATESTAVRIVGTQNAVANCTYLTNVRGDQNVYGGIFAGAAYEDALNQMKNKTAQAGGNTLYIISASTGWAGSNTIGDAFRC